MAEKITSAANARVKRVIALQTKSRERRKAGAFVIEGERIFADTPEDCILEVYAAEHFLEQATGEVAEKLRRCGAIPVADAVFTKMSDTGTPQGVLALVREPCWQMEDLFPAGREPLLLLSENIQDPGNLGTMIRAAEAAGVTGIVMSKGTVDLYNPKTVRSTMSAIFRVPILRAEDFPGTLKELRERGVSLYAAHLAADFAYDEGDYRGPSAFLIGNEGNGLSEEAASLAQKRVLIPMQGKIESLNAAVAASVLLFEAARQRRRG